MVWSTDAMKTLERMRQKMDEMMGRGSVSSSYSFPLVNVYDNQDELTLIAEMPGVNRQDVSISMQDGVLTIAGKRTVPEHEKEFTVLRCELPEGNFEKSLELPTKVEESKISAKLEDGILRVSLPKTEDAKPRQITVEV